MSDSLMKFVLKMGEDQEKRLEQIEDIDKTVEKIYAEQEKQAKLEKKNKEVAKREKRRAEQLRKRKDQDRPNLVQGLFGKKPSKKEGMSIFQKVLVGMGIGAAGIATGAWLLGDSKEAKELRADIKEKVDEWAVGLKRELQKVLDEFTKEFKKKVDEWTGQFKDEVVDAPFREMSEGIVNTLNPGEGKTAKGTVFSAADVTAFATKSLDAARAREMAEFGNVNNRYSGEALKPFREVNRRLALTAELQKQLDRAQKRGDNLKKGMDEGRLDKKYTQKQIDRLNKEIADLLVNKEQNAKMLTTLWEELGISEDDLKEVQNKAGRSTRTIAPNVTIPSITPTPEQRQTGGAVGLTTKVLHKDEALSSLTRGRNDYVKPGGSSVVSRTPWSSITPDTPVHAYKDSVGQSTIGWGSTYYDSILKGKQPVKMGDTITKKKADQVLANNIAGLANTYAQKLRHWAKMTEKQKAGILSLGYNAPYGPIGAYPKLTSALQRGDMTSAAANVQRGGPSAHRISEERRLIQSGPSDLTKVKAEVKSNPVSAVKSGNPFSNWLGGLFKKPEKKQIGGVVGASQQRFAEAQSKFHDTVGNKTRQSVVVVKRQPAVSIPAPKDERFEMDASGSGVNIVELSDQLHRIQAGASY
ncbi:TolA protein [Synechococcus phage S-B68]|nr:TolA protein [Synechococcus phage S-B68]